MNERIKELRTKMNLTQQAFADKLHLKRNTVATYEMGKSIPSDAAIALMCEKFNVSENWLRTGEGDMFVLKSKDEEISAFLGEIMEASDSNALKRLIRAMARLTYEEREVIQKIMDEAYKANNEKE